MRQSPSHVRSLMIDEGFWAKVFKRIGEGVSLRSIAEDHGVAYSTLHDRIHADDERKRRYLEALTSRAMHHAARIEELVELVESGKLEPHAAKVAIDARKWIASRFHPRQFSERLALDARVEKIDLAQMHLQELKNLMQKKKVKEINPEKTDALENQSPVE